MLHVANAVTDLNSTDTHFKDSVISRAVAKKTAAVGQDVQQQIKQLQL
jgi:hypothetical protein